MQALQSALGIVAILAFASAIGTTADEAWAHLRDDVESGRTTITTRLRLLTR